MHEYKITKGLVIEVAISMLSYAFSDESYIKKLQIIIFIPLKVEMMKQKGTLIILNENISEQDTKSLPSAVIYE